MDEFDDDLFADSLLSDDALSRGVDAALDHNPPPPPPKRQSLQENAGEKSAIEKLCELKKLIHGEPSPDEYQTKRISKGWGTLVSKLHAPVAPADPGYRFL